MATSLFMHTLLLGSLLVGTDAKLGRNNNKLKHPPKHAFVFLGPTGDNALRDNGVWQGLFESFAGGVYDSSDVGIVATMNTPHTDEELYTDVMATLNPLYEQLQSTPGWECKQSSGDCDPESFYKLVQTNIWEGRDADAQAKDMIPTLAIFDIISVYMSIPPYAFGGWAEAAATNWGAERVNVAAEKPFGTSTEDAANLYAGINAVLPQDHLQLVDHWLSFFMVRHLPYFRPIIESILDVEWSSKAFSKIVITEHETRGLEGRGGFFDGIGQVRDMMQSHLLQVLGLLLIDPDAPDRSDAKHTIFENLSVNTCTHGQYDGWLLEDGLSYHPDFADATYSTMTLDVNLEDWKDTEVVITTGKLMGTILYTVEMYEAGGPGVLTYNIGAESVGLANIEVSSWRDLKSSKFTAPLPGFTDDKFFQTKPDVSSKGDGYILTYDVDNMYFPKPYAMMISDLLRADYSTAFVTYPECHQSWVVVTASSDSLCLDPLPDKVAVYNPPDSCGNTPPEVCYTGYSVEYLYNVTFACSAEHNVEYADIDFYQARCPPTVQLTETGGACYDFRVDECTCDSLSCTQDLCENGMGLIWSTDCPNDCDPDKCDPLSPSKDDPSCTGPPELIDRFSKKMYRRKLIHREITLDDELGGTFCHLTFELCKGESSITQEVDAGNSDYYRIAASEELRDYKGTKEYRYSGMHSPTKARSYSPVNPLNAQNLQFIIKKDLGTYEDPSLGCTPGVDCEFGMSALACEAPVGSDFLISAEPDIGPYAGPTSHEAMYSTIDTSPGAGPYTINVIGQGVALTELNIVGMSELLNPFASDGSFSTVESYNYLWANSYWSSAEWVWEKAAPVDLARQFTRGMGKYGIRFNLMHAISREERPEAEYPRITSEVIGEAFNLINTTKQDPNIKWLVVGSSGFKRSMYPLILEYGFDMYVLPDAGTKGYPYIGPNSLHMNVPAGGDASKRERSPLFKYYENMEKKPR